MKALHVIQVKAALLKYLMPIQNHEEGLANAENEPIEVPVKSVMTPVLKPEQAQEDRFRYSPDFVR